MRFMTEDTLEPWTFNKNYDDYAQVEHMLPDFLAVLAELEAAGQYRYNDSFKGRIPGLAGCTDTDEDSGIYMLQGLERVKVQEAKVEAWLADGHVWVETITAPTKYSHIVCVPTRRMGGSLSEYHDARLVPRNGTGRPYAVLPKGKRTNGYAVEGRRVLAKQ